MECVDELFGYLWIPINFVDHIPSFEMEDSIPSNTTSLGSGHMLNGTQIIFGYRNPADGMQWKQNDL